MHSIKKDDSKMSQNTHKRESKRERKTEREAKTKNSRFWRVFLWLRGGLGSTGDEWKCPKVFKNLVSQMRANGAQTQINTHTHVHTHVHGDPHTSTHSQLNEHIHAGGLEEELSLKFGIECQLVKEQEKRGRRRQRQRRKLSERASEARRNLHTWLS